MCSEHTPFFEYTARALSGHDYGWIPAASLALSAIARAHVRTKSPRRGYPCPVASCRGGAASIFESLNSASPNRVFVLMRPIRLLAKFPPLLSEVDADVGYRTRSIARSAARTIVTCSLPRRREPAGRRPYGAAGRPRAASRASQPPGETRKTARPGLPLRIYPPQRKSSTCRKGAPPVLSHSFCPPRHERWLTKWRRGVGRQARQKRGECALYFKTLSPLGGYERDRAPVHTPLAAIPSS